MSTKTIAVIGDDDGSVTRAVLQLQAAGAISSSVIPVNLSLSKLGQGVQAPPCRIKQVIPDPAAAASGYGAGVALREFDEDFLRGRKPWPGTPKD